MLRNVGSRACVFLLLLSSFPLLLSVPTAAAPVLSVSPTSLSAQTAVGGNVPSQTVRVTNTGTGTLRWSIVGLTFVGPTKDWLAVSPTNGTTSAGGNNLVTVNFLTSTLAAGEYAASFQITSNTGSSVTVSVTLTIVSGSNPPPAGVGPQASITCPAGAVDIWPAGLPIQTMVNSNPAGTRFCLHTGVYQLTASVRPLTGDKFFGEYGAILDGTGWSTADGTQAAFRAHNEDIDSVEIRNLVIRNMPQHGIQAFYFMSDHWTIEYNE